jgi:hypothetical protein
MGKPIYAWFLGNRGTLDDLRIGGFVPIKKLASNRYSFRSKETGKVIVVALEDDKDLALHNQARWTDKVI